MSEAIRKKLKEYGYKYIVHHKETGYIIPFKSKKEAEREVKETNDDVDYFAYPDSYKVKIEKI